MTEAVQVTLSRDEALVLFEWLAQRSEARLQTSSEPLNAAEIVLSGMEAMLEKSLAEVLADNYAKLVEAARRRIEQPARES